jgi:hypothetical protein
MESRCRTAYTVVVDRLRHHVARKIGPARFRKFRQGITSKVKCTHIPLYSGLLYSRRRSGSGRSSKEQHLQFQRKKRVKETYHILREGPVQTFRIQRFPKTCWSMRYAHAVKSFSRINPRLSHGDAVTEFLSG